MTDAPASTGQILLYRSEDGRTRLDVRLDNGTVWLNQRQLTELFGKAKGTISEHITHIFEDGELDPTATVRQFRTVQSEGDREVSRDVEFYNLDMIIALGFRVRSPAAVSHAEALDWAGAQYDAFVDRRRIEAEVKASERYVDDLAATAKLLESAAASPGSTVRKPRGKRT